MDKTRAGQAHVYSAAGKALIDDRQQPLVEFIQIFKAGSGKGIFPREPAIGRYISIFGGGSADING